MTIKLTVLKSGESIISDIKEAYNESNEFICYVFEKPCFIEINGTYRIAGEDNKLSISLKSWPLFSDDDAIEIAKDSIVTVVTPTPELEQMYRNQVLGDDKNETNQSNLSNEQSDSHQSD